MIEPAVKGLASRIGEVEEVQLKLPAGFFGVFVRVRVKIAINAKIQVIWSVSKVTTICPRFRSISILLQ